MAANLYVMGVGLHLADEKLDFCLESLKVLLFSFGGVWGFLDETLQRAGNQRIVFLRIRGEQSMQDRQTGQREEE